jgi:hypothetical protein
MTAQPPATLPLSRYMPEVSGVALALSMRRDFERFCD